MVLTNKKDSGRWCKKTNMFFIIPEHGKSPWRSRRCNRGWGFAKSLRSVTSEVNFGGKAANPQMIRKPEDLIKNLLREPDGKRNPGWALAYPGFFMGKQLTNIYYLRRLLWKKKVSFPIVVAAGKLAQDFLILFCSYQKQAKNSLYFSQAEFAAGARRWLWSCGASCWTG